MTTRKIDLSKDAITWLTFTAMGVLEIVTKRKLMGLT